ncbi:MAG: nitroreductase, partial [Anaerocolumna sp.]|nr:nitroreductase [Anaerocolumna sp.]
MDFMECIKSRRSVRKYKSDKVPMECIRKAVEAASFAPSWKNSQVTRYYAVTTEEIKEKVADFVPSFNQPAIKSAPVLMVVTVIKQRSGYNREGQADTSKGDGWQMYD